ncbi:MAG: arylamine N-acetyltransferase family protein [Nocardioides sp.]
MTIAHSIQTESHLDDALIDGYLSKLGFGHRPEPTLENLAKLQQAQVLRIPFENLDYHFGNEIPMDPTVVRKIVEDNRGGGCYELNPAFHYLISSLGFDSRILPGRSYRDGVLGQPMMHLVLEVVVDGTAYLVDTGFRRNSQHPLDMTTAQEQVDPAGVYALSAASSDQVDVHLNGEPLYQFDRRGATIEDFAPTLWWWRTCPESPFLQSIFCSKPTETGRVTITGRRLTVNVGAERTSQELGSDDQVLAAYREHFDMDLPSVPALSEHGGARPGIRLE